MVAAVARRTAGLHWLAALVAMLAVVAGTQTVLAPSAGAAGLVAISGSASGTFPASPVVAGRAATVTTTTLFSFPNSAFQGVPMVLLANVAPRGAAGSIQIMDGTTALGVPVPAATGFALLITPLPKGTHSLTAMFTPTDPTAFTPSTSSPMSLTVNSIF